MKRKMKLRLTKTDDFFSNDTSERKKNFPFLVDMTVSMWRMISRPIVEITEMTLGSALNALIRFEISHPYSKEIQRRKDEFPFAVDMQDAWRNILKSMNNVKKILPKNRLSAGGAKV